MAVAWAGRGGSRPRGHGTGTRPDRPLHSLPLSPHRLVSSSHLLDAAQVQVLQEAGVGHAGGGGAAIVGARGLGARQQGGRGGQGRGQECTARRVDDGLNRGGWGGGGDGGVREGNACRTQMRRAPESTGTVHCAVAIGRVRASGCGRERRGWPGPARSGLQPHARWPLSAREYGGGGRCGPPLRFRSLHDGRPGASPARIRAQCAARTTLAGPAVSDQAPNQCSGRAVAAFRNACATYTRCSCGRASEEECRSLKPRPSSCSPCHFRRRQRAQWGSPGRRRGDRGLGRRGRRTGKGRERARGKKEAHGPSPPQRAIFTPTSPPPSKTHRGPGQPGQRPG